MILGCARHLRCTDKVFVPFSKDVQDTSKRDTCQIDFEISEERQKFPGGYFFEGCRMTIGTDVDKKRRKNSK